MTAASVKQTTRNNNKKREWEVVVGYGTLPFSACLNEKRPTFRSASYQCREGFSRLLLPPLAEATQAHHNRTIFILQHHSGHIRLNFL